MKSNFWLKIITPALILILGIVLFFTVSFNKSLELSGYHLIEVNISDNTLSDSLEKIDGVLEGKEIDIKEYSLEKDDYGNVIAIKFITTVTNTQELEESIKDELYEAFGYDESSLIEQTYIKVSGFIEPQNIGMTFAGTGLAIIIGLVGIFVYIALRHSVANAFSVVLSVILDTLLMISLTLICRLPITSHYGIAIVGTAIFSIVLNTLFYSKLVDNSKEETMLKASNEEVIKSTQQSFAHTLILISLTCLIAIGAFAFYNLSTSVSLALGFIACLYTSQMLVPHLWAMAYRRRIRVKKDKDNKAEKVEEIKE